MHRMKVLITVKTYPIPSAKYDELVCTAGVREDGSFVRLYPINFRDLPFSQQYKKYQWIEVAAVKHRGRDARKESYRPDCATIRLLGEPIPSLGNWKQRAKYALAQRSMSMEELQSLQRVDRTSLGVFRPKRISDLIWQPDAPDWKAVFQSGVGAGTPLGGPQSQQSSAPKSAVQVSVPIRVRRRPLPRPSDDDRGLGARSAILASGGPRGNARRGSNGGSQEVPRYDVRA